MLDLCELCKHNWAECDGEPLHLSHFTGKIPAGGRADDPVVFCLHFELRGDYK